MNQHLSSFCSARACPSIGCKDILGFDPGTGNDSLGSCSSDTHRDASANFAEAVEMNQHLSSFCSA